MKKINYYQYFLTALLSLLFSCTCATDNNTVKEIDPTTKASIRVFNFSLGSVVLQLLQNDRKAIESIPYGIVSNGYVSVPSGIRNLRVTNSTNNAVFSVNADLTPNLNTTLYLIDTITTISGILLKDVPSVLSANECAIRLIHGGLHAQQATLSISETGSPIISDIAFRSFSQYVLIPIGSALTLNVKTDSGSISLPIPSSSFAGGSGHDIILYGSVTDAAAPLAVAVIR